MSNQIETVNNVLETANEMPIMECGLTFDFNSTAITPIGTYESNVIDVFYEQNVKTDNGLKNRLYIEHEFMVDGERHTIKHSLTISDKPNSRYRKAGKAIAEKLGRPFDWSVVANKSAIIDVQHFLTGQGDLCAFVNDADYDVLGKGIMQQNDIKGKDTEIQSPVIIEEQEIQVSNDESEQYEQQA